MATSEDDAPARCGARPDDQPHTPRTGPWDRVLIALLLAVMGGELAQLATGYPWLGKAVDIGVIAVALAAARRFGLREIYLLTLCAGLSLVAWRVAPDPAAVIWAALDQAAFLMAFILLVGLIQQAGVTSAAVKACGLYLTRQPAGRRYFALFLGTNSMAQLFNLGAVSLLTPLIQRGGEEAAADGLQPIRQRRQLNAMLRGFAWGVVWSPTAVAPVVLATLLPAAERGPWMAAGLGVAILVMLIGWAEDRWTYRALRRQIVSAAPHRAPPFPKGPALRFLVVCLALLSITVAAMTAFDRSVVFGLMVASPIILTGWLIVQSGGLSAPARARAAGRLAEIGAGYLPRSAPLAVTLACSGFVGSAAAALIPTEALAAALGVADAPGWLFLLSLSVGVAALSQFALSPIMMAVFFGTLIADLPALPADMTWAALAISCGWGLSMTISPFATIVLMIQGMTGLTGREMTWRWNWRFTALCVLALAVVYYGLTRNG